MKPSLSPRRRWTRRLLLVGLVVLACQQLWRHTHDYIFAEKFATVEAGRLYRGAWLKPWPMKRVVRNHQIKTVVALAHRPTHPLAIQEKGFAEELGFRWVHIPIVDNREADDGQQLFDRLEEAAAVLADAESQPVYFHCHHGVNRTSMVQMAYRMLHCGWDLDEATEEIARSFGLKEVNNGPDYRHMTAFYKDRILPRRQAEADAEVALEDAGTPTPTRR